jgi:exodeoxyribonuclease-3
VRIATWNVNGIRARQTQFAEWLHREAPDIVCLQELKAESAQIPELCKLDDYWAYWHCLRGYSGVSLHVRKDLLPSAPVFEHPDFDMESRIVQFDLGNVVVASVYVPNGGKNFPAKLAFLERLIAWTRRVHEEGRELVLCGDMNIAHSDMDVHPKENLFTWWAPWRNLRARNIGWRLDYVLASKAIAARAESCVVLAEVGTSDHAPVVMQWSRRG